MNVRYNSLKIVLISIIVMIILFILGIGVKTIIDKTGNDNDAGGYEQSEKTHDEIVFGDDELGISVEVDKALQDYHNIALLGIDTAEIEDKHGNRSDAIVIISIHNKTKEVKIFSVFRDTYLKIDDNYGLDKINHAYAFGGKNLSLKALNQNLELNIRDSVVLPWNAVRDIVDDLGGIEVEILESELGYLNSGLDADNQIKGTGVQTLNGEQAVFYSRIRKDSAQGDVRRNERFKIVLLAAFEKAKTYDTEELAEMLDEAMHDVDSNMSRVDVIELFYDMAYHVDDVFEWPYDCRGWMYNSIYYMAPENLENNVERLHEEMFGQTDYEAGEYVKQVSSEISDRTGF